MKLCNVEITNTQNESVNFSTTANVVYDHKRNILHINDANLIPNTKIKEIDTSLLETDEPGRNTGLVINTH